MFETEFSTGSKLRILSIAESSFLGEILFGEDNFKSHISLEMSKLALSSFSILILYSLDDRLHFLSCSLSLSLLEYFLSADFPLF
mgnify:CR=1 FL=1